MQRQNMKQMLNDWQVNFPGRIESMFTAMRNVVPSHLCDNELFDFKSIDKNSGVINGGDLAFDKETLAESTTNKLPTQNNIEVIEIK